MEKWFFEGASIESEQAGEGVRRKVLAHSKTLMLVQIDFEKDAVGAVHTHPHEQATYVVSGSFRFTNGGEAAVVNAGDSLRFAPNVEHGTVCLQPGRIVDVFTPCREDFLKE